MIGLMYSMAKVAIYGFGNQNKETAKMLVERGIPVVAVIVNKTDVGQDFGTLCGIGEQGVVLTAGTDAVEPSSQQALTWLSWLPYQRSAILKDLSVIVPRQSVT